MKCAYGRFGKIGFLSPRSAFTSNEYTKNKYVIALGWIGCFELTLFVRSGKTPPGQGRRHIFSPRAFHQNSAESGRRFITNAAQVGR